MGEEKFIVGVATYLLTGFVILLIFLFLNILIFAARREYLEELQQIRNELRSIIGAEVDEPLNLLDFLEMIPTLALWPFLASWCLWSSFRQGVPCILVKARKLLQETRERNDTDDDEDT